MSFEFLTAFTFKMKRIKCILINSQSPWKFVYLFLIIYDAIQENLFGFATDRNTIYYAKQTVHNDAKENVVELNVYECKMEFRCTTFTFEYKI